MTRQGTISTSIDPDSPDLCRDIIDKSRPGVYMTLTVADRIFVLMFRHVPCLLIRTLPSGTFTNCFEESGGEFQFVVVDRVGHVLVDPFGYIGVEILEHVSSFLNTL